MYVHRLLRSAGALPLNYRRTYAFRKNLAMLIDANLSFDEINQAVRDLYERGGVYLYNNTQKVWVEENTNTKEERKGYEIYASSSSLKITSGDDPSYWEWRRESEPSRPTVEIKVACLKRIKWLEVRGKLSTIKLTACTDYKVYFILKTTTVDGKTWDPNLPVTSRLYVPNIGRQEKQWRITGRPDEWREYEVGGFYNDRRTVGTIEFQMEQLDNVWKQGLVIKGVKIQPAPFQ